MESFHQSLKYLLQHAPADFIGFGLGDATVRVLAPVPCLLSARGRDIDGAYLIARAPAAGAEIAEEDKRVAHLEMHRRHQAAENLALDVAEAQLRLFRRERRLVVSHVWDLDGDANASVLEEQTFPYGEAGSRCVYLRVNLRGLGCDELLAQGPPALWSLVALTRDGAREATIVRARDAIEGRSTWTMAERADRLAVLWFVAEAEGVPVKLMQTVLSKARLMESELYKSIAEEGEASDEAREEASGEAQGRARSVLLVLAARGIPVSDVIRERVLGCADVVTLDVWVRRAAVASTAAAVVRAKAPARSARKA